VVGRDERVSRRPEPMPVTSGRVTGSPGRDPPPTGPHAMTTLQLARLALLALHLTGVATILLTWALQLRPRRPRRLWPMAAGAGVAIATGAALVIVRLLAELPVDLPKVAVKLLVAAALLVAAVLAASRRGSGPSTPRSRRYTQTAGLLAVGNVVIALAWN
jgi:hypothetical protein